MFPRIARSLSALARVGAVALPVLLASPIPLSALSSAARAADGNPAQKSLTGTPLFDGLGKHRRKVTTTSKEAQRYFDQGLVFVFAFNHDEAIRSFTEAAALDSTCAMAWWGISLANGPHINNPAMDPARSWAAWESLQKALSTAAGASPVERDLIEALSSRYVEVAPENRADLDAAYAAAMREVSRKYPKDADVAVLFAEAMMDLRPWDLWKPDGSPQPGTEEILSTLDRALQLNSRHPGANHLLVHAAEASPHPERALEAADRLRTLVPGAGHLVHMPAHIDCRTGGWKQAVEANQRAIEADRAYRQQSPRQDFYRVYMAHNHHFLSWAAMMRGQSAVAIGAARAMIAGIPVEWLEQAAFFADGYMPIALEALMRFGKWEDILKEPKPAAYLPITTAQWHFARGVAYAATDRVDLAKAEREQFQAACARVTDAMIVGNNPARRVLRISSNKLDGEIAYAEGSLEEAIRSLRVAAAIEDSLRYNESPDWLQPVRHTLGGVLLDAGKLPEAETAYREDLARWPENGWSLFGLAQCLRARGEKDEARKVEKRFEKIWADADVKLEKTCLCLVRGAEAARM